MRRVVSASLIITGIIQLLALSGVVGPNRLSALYDIPFTDPNLIILMRHRAVLFGILGCAIIAGAFWERHQTTAFVVGFVSVISFLLLAAAVGGYNEQLARVFAADCVALVSLIVGAAVKTYLDLGAHVNGQPDR